MPRIVSAGEMYYGPVWVHVNKLVLDRQGIPEALVPGRGDDGRSFLPLFTTRELAEQSIVAFRWDDITVLRLSTPGVVKGAVAYWLRNGVEYVAIDVISGTADGRFCPIRDFYAAIRDDHIG